MIYRDLEKRERYMKKYHHEHPPNKFYREANKKAQRKYRWILKQRVFEMLGGCFCVKCKITDIRILTINHKNGGGRKERESRKGLLLDILKGRRKIDDLEVRCQNCNILYEYEVGRLFCPI